MQKPNYSLTRTSDRLELVCPDEKNFNPIYVDFINGAMGHRIKYGGGKGQLIAKAVGFARYKHPSVLDVTAGLGRDGFLLATLGADVTMLERSDIIYALLEDGLNRARKESWVRELNIQCIHTDALTYMDALSPDSFPDIIYLDPMFPHSKKSALVKKEMRILRDIVGDDDDSPALLKKALTCAKKRVVVKRARLAPPIEGPEPNLILEGKSARYDLYLIELDRPQKFKYT